MGFVGRYDLETETPVRVKQWPHQTQPQILFHYSDVLPGTLGVTQLVVLKWDVELNGLNSVSYTHLTLPTIYSV